MWVFISDQDLEFSIFDATRSPRIGPRGHDRLSEEDRRKVAAGIMEKLRMSGWRVTREKRAWHSSPPATLQFEAAELAKHRAREEEIGGIEPQEPEPLP